MIFAGAADYEDTISDYQSDESLDYFEIKGKTAADGSPIAIMELKVPRTSFKIFHDLASYLCTTRRVEPMIFVPGSCNFKGSISVFNNRTNFVCLWDSRRSSYEMTNLPESSMLIIFQEETALGQQVTYTRPSKTSVTVFTPDGKLHKISSPAILQPHNLENPVVLLPLSNRFPVAFTFNDFVSVVKAICDSMPQDPSKVSLQQKEEVGKKKTSEMSAFAVVKTDKGTVCQFMLHYHEIHKTLPNFRSKAPAFRARERFSVRILTVILFYYNFICV